VGGEVSHARLPSALCPMFYARMLYALGRHAAALRRHASGL
jgi:hypothetical protein